MNATLHFLLDIEICNWRVLDESKENATGNVCGCNERFKRASCLAYPCVFIELERTLMQNISTYITNCNRIFH